MVRRVIPHSLYFHSPRSLLHKSSLQQGLIIQIEPTLCCTAEEGIGILKTCFQESKEDIGDAKLSRHTPEGSTWRGACANTQGLEALPGTRSGKGHSHSWELTQGPEERSSFFHELHKLLEGRQRF